jgi:hypothetical protein
MNDSEVHSLILDRVEEIEDDELRTFLTNVLRHEREILDEPRAQYKDQYKSLVDGYIDNNSISEYDE